MSEIENVNKVTKSINAMANLTSETNEYLLWNIPSHIPPLARPISACFCCKVRRDRN